MDRPAYLKALQRYVANIGITGSSLRNQGAAGVVDAARCFLAGLDLAQVRALEVERYAAWLDQTTAHLLAQFPQAARKWGAARKAINIFAAHVALNRELASEYDLARFGDVMETPLDRMAACELQRRTSSKLPRWKGVGALTPESSRLYQIAATELARREGLCRCCLDIILWRPESEGVTGREQWN